MLGPLPVWYHPAYRLPVPALESALGIEPRRADLVVWALEAAGGRRRIRVRTPTRVSYAEMSRVHTADWLAEIGTPGGLARVFGLETGDVPVDETLATVRLATGGTIAAARWALEHRRPAVNLLGGFHHAGPDRGAGMCPINDVAIAIAVLRGGGFRGKVAVLDLDAHPPDGTAACLAGDPSAWIGSLSGSSWGPLPGVDETVLAEGADDQAYLAALEALLARAPAVELAFVIAGCDVLAGDRLGMLGLSLQGTSRRDARVRRWLGSVGSVWVPGGGYHRDAWRVLAATTAALAGFSRPLPADADPVAHHFARVSAGLDTAGLGADDPLTEASLAAVLGGPADPRLLDTYTAEGIEYGLHAFGILRHYQRLGYDRFRVTLGRGPTGDRFQLFAWHDNTEHLLAESVLGRERLAAGDEVLLVNWLTLRHPVGRFTAGRARLPGQDVPGPGLAREATELLQRIAVRLSLAGVALRPAWYHTAVVAHDGFAFVEPRAEGRYQALQRDLGHLPLDQVSRAIDAGRVSLNGVRWAWSPDTMVSWREPRELDPEVVRNELEQTRFILS